MKCWSCGAGLDLEKVSFRALCEACGAYLHCCRNCKHHQLGRTNECKIPGTELISDRSKGNLCDDFSPLGEYKEKKRGSSKGFDDLFK